MKVTVAEVKELAREYGANEKEVKIIAYISEQIHQHVYWNESELVEMIKHQINARRCA